MNDIDQHPSHNQSDTDGKHGIKPGSDKVRDDGIFLEKREFSEKTHDISGEKSGDDGNEHTSGSQRTMGKANRTVFDDLGSNDDQENNQTGATGDKPLLS